MLRTSNQPCQHLPTMSNRSQGWSQEPDGQHGNGDRGSEPAYEINSLAPKRRTRRGGVKLRARAVRRTQRLALEEEERKVSDRAQADAEAVRNAARFSGMQSTLHKWSDAQDDRAAQTTKGASVPSFGIEEVRNVVQQDEAKVPVEKDIKSATESSYLADLEGLIFESSPESERGTGGELDLDAWAGGLAECFCEMICVCDRPQCKCVDGCICD